MSLARKHERKWARWLAHESGVEKELTKIDQPVDREALAAQDNEDVETGSGVFDDPKDDWQFIKDPNELTKDDIDQLINYKTKEDIMSNSINAKQDATTNGRDTIYYGVVYGPANEHGYRKIESEPTILVASSPTQARDKFLFGADQELRDAILSQEKAVFVFAVNAYIVA